MFLPTLFQKPTQLENRTGAGKSQQIDPNTANYSEESLVGYRWFDTKKVPVMYPFGYGLTYTAFEYCKPDSQQETVWQKRYDRYFL